MAGLPYQVAFCLNLISFDRNFHLALKLKLGHPIQRLLLLTCLKLLETQVFTNLFPRQTFPLMLRLRNLDQ